MDDENLEVTNNNDNGNLENDLSWAGKLVFASLAAYVANSSMKKMPVKLKGDPEKIRALVDAVMAAKDFQEEAQKPNANIEEIIKKLNIKNINANKFEEIVGKKWPLR